MTLAVIPARAGSKGIPRKNLTRLGAVTLLEHAIHCAMQAEAVAVTVVSTDDPEAADIAAKREALVRWRPDELAEDDTPMAPVLLDAVEWVEDLTHRSYGAVVTLQPTSPLRTGRDVSACVSMLVKSRADSVVSCVRVEDLHPARMHWGSGEAVWTPEKENQRRQELPACYVRNGAVYVTRTEQLYRGTIYGGRTAWYEMPKVRSVNIDDEIDLVICEAIWDAYHRGGGQRSRGEPVRG